MRLRFMFWLDLSKKDEHNLAKKIENLKQERSFARTIRDGIRLVCNLREGKTEVLQELFPWVLEQASAEKAMTESPPPKDNIAEQLARLETLILDNKSTSSGNPKPLKAVGGPKAMTVPQFEAPQFDDIEPLELNAAQNTDATFNFLSQLYSLQGETAPDWSNYRKNADENGA